MLNPTPFFAPDFFDTKDVTLKRLQKFSLSAIQRLGLDNPGSVFTPLVNELTGLHTALFGSMQLADQGISRRRGQAQLMWEAIGDLQEQLENDEELIDYKSKKTPGIRTDFFPNNREEYSRATLLTADLLFARAEKAALDHAKTLGEDFDASKYSAFYQAFKDARKATGEGDEQTDKANAAASTQRDDLTGRLSDAVKQVAAQFPRDAARCSAYFQFWLLLPGETAPDTDAPAPTA